LSVKQALAANFGVALSCVLGSIITLGLGMHAHTILIFFVC
jgi:hypothetical protein